MSGFGLGGFGSGFLAGFEVMGAQLARRGLMQREAEQSRRADRTLALEEELRRQEAARQEREAASMEQYRGAQTRSLDDQHNWYDRQRQSELESEEASRKLTGAQTTALGDQHNWYDRKAQSDLQSDAAGRELTTEQVGQLRDRREYDRTDRPLTVAGKQADVAASQATTEQIKNTTRYAEQDRPLTVEGKKADIAATLASTGVNVANAQGRQLDNQGKALEVDQAQRQEQIRQQASQAWERLDRGEGTPDDVKRIYPLLGAVTNPEHESDVATVFGALQEAAKNGGSVVPFNKPEVMGPLNRTFGETINVTRGMPITRDGRYVVGDSELVQMIKHPTENLLGFEIRVRPEPSPERRAEIEDEMQTANPARRRELEAELNPEPYQTGLTTQRTPVAQGGQMRWFTPQEVQGMVMGMKGISDFRASRPELVQELSRLKQRIDTGEIGGAADLDTALKLKRDARADRKEQLDIERGERGARIERQKIKAGQRQEARQSYEIGAQMIEDSYTLTGPDGQAGLSMDAGPKMNAEKLELAKILKHDPTLTGPEAYARVKKRMAKQNAASMAQSGVKPPESKMGRLKQLFGGEPEPKKDFSQLWN